jgi:ATP-binding cassette subfamily B protein
LLLAAGRKPSGLVAPDGLRRNANVCRHRTACAVTLADGAKHSKIAIIEKDLGTFCDAYTLTPGRFFFGIGGRRVPRLKHVVLVPGAVLGCLDDAGLSHRDLWLANSTDVSLVGEPAQEWIVVASDHVSVVGLRGPAKLLRSVCWNEIKSFRTQAGIGGGTLQAKVGDDWVDLLRFSNAFAARFHKVSRLLEQMRERPDDWFDAYADRITDETEPSFDPPECPSCSLRLASKEQACPRCVQQGQILRRVNELIRPYRKGAILLCLLTIAGVAAELIPPKLQQYMIDNVLAGHVLPGNAVPGNTINGQPAAGETGQVQPDFKTALLMVVLALAASRVMLSVVGVFKGQLATIIGTGLTSTLRAQMVRKLQSLAIVYYDRHQVGSMLSRVAHDSEAMHGLMHQITGGFLLQIVQLIGVGGMLIWINPKLALFTLIPVPLVFLGTWIFWRKVYPRYYRLWDASAKQITVLSGMLSGIRVVKAFAQEDREFNRFSRSSEDLRNWRLWVEKTNAIYSATMGLVFSLGGLIVWYVGGLDVIGASMTLGELIAFLAYLAMFYAPLGALSNFTSWLTSFLTGSKRVMELLDTPLTVAETLNPKDWPEPKGDIRFEDVTFGYDRNQPVLKNISFDVKAGEMVGIVGRSGSGKSTMVNLLGRFYDVQEGRILVDGIDLRDLSTQQLRDRLGIVFQESFLFRGTIWRNLSYGRHEATPEEGLAAAKAAGAHDFICRQQLAYETLLGEHGAGLSGGEKQRLSIARTLLYDPKILVLDEATSNIDAEAEKSIQDALKVLVRGRTTLAIAHRLSTLRNADRILVFDLGQLIEQGTHAELLALDGTYARLVRIQTSISKDPNVDRLLQTAEQPRESYATLAIGASGLDTTTSGGGTALLEEEPEEPVEESTAQELRWLEPNMTEFIRGDHDRIELWIDGERICSSVFVVRTFPATRPYEYLSVRGWNESGDEYEVGIIRRMDGWPQRDRVLMEESLSRRYLLRKIVRVHHVKLQFGYLDVDVETTTGREKFTMRWTQSQAIDFGDNGKLIIDAKENRYVIDDVDALPPADRERFLQFVYW